MASSIPTCLNFGVTTSFPSNSDVARKTICSRRKSSSSNSQSIQKLLCSLGSHKTSQTRKAGIVLSRVRKQNTTIFPTKQNLSFPLTSRFEIGGLLLGSRIAESKHHLRTTSCQASALSSTIPESSDSEDKPGILAACDRIYPDWVDYFPTLVGKLNPITGLLAYFTGFVLVECQNVQSAWAALQWLCLVLLPTHAVLAYVKYLLYRRKLPDKETPPAVSRAAFIRHQRSAWIDFHIIIQLLVVAGMSGSQGADMWLAVIPIVMFLRFIWHRRWAPLARVSFWVHRVMSVVTLVPALGMLAAYTVRGLQGTVKTIGTSGLWGVLALPLAFAVTYFMYVAPASRIPSALLSAWRGERTTHHLESAPKPPPKEVLSPEEKAARRKTRNAWIIAYVVATAISQAFKTEIPFYLLMVVQLFKQSPDKLLQIMIDKGDASHRKRTSKAPLYQRLEDRSEWIRTWRIKTDKAKQVAKTSSAPLNDRLADRSAWIGQWREGQPTVQEVVEVKETPIESSSETFTESLNPGRSSAKSFTEQEDQDSVFSSKNELAVPSTASSAASFEERLKDRADWIEKWRNSQGQ